MFLTLFYYKICRIWHRFGVCY